MRWFVLLMAVVLTAGCGDKDHGKNRDKDRPRAAPPAEKKDKDGEKPPKG